jgi:hypothetical protein
MQAVVWTFPSMFLRYLNCLVASLLLLIGLTGSAEAECGDTNPIISRVLCSDDTLRRMEEEILAKYQAAITNVAAIDRPFLEAAQSVWQSRRRRICSKTTEPGSTDEDIRKCLAGTATSQLERLEAWPDFGKVKMLVDAPADEKACALVLDRSNLIWYKDIEWGTDLYEPLVPASAAEPTWAAFNGSRHIKYARFDFLNEGVIRDVYRIESDPDRRSRFRWHVVVADGEEEVVRERVTTLSDDLLDRSAEFRADLRRMSVNGFPEFDGDFDSQRRAPSLRSMLVDLAPDNRVLVLNGITYVVVANYRAMAALVRPDKTESLTALCRHAAVPSRAETKIEVLSADHSCPVGMEGQPIAWEGDQWDMHAVIDLKEWGGRRVVTRRLESVGARYANTHIYVGALDDPTPPDRNAWQPLDGATEDHDSAELLLTLAGAYILIDDWIPIRPDYMPLGQTYYRIVDNGLTEACRATRETIPPPGYAVKN